MGKNKFSFGAIWRIPDEKIKFPKSLFRTYHNERIVTIIENSNFNFDKNEDYILVAPLSSQTLEHHSTDIFIKPNNENKLDKDSYIRMRAIQFIEKSSCKKYIGKLTDDVKCDILTTLNIYINNGQV